eukprot:3314337-Rhodomonas_salina.1
MRTLARLIEELSAPKRTAAIHHRISFVRHKPAGAAALHAFRENSSRRDRHSKYRCRNLHIKEHAAVLAAASGLCSAAVLNPPARKGTRAETNNLLSTIAEDKMARNAAPGLLRHDEGVEEEGFRKEAGATAP